MQKGQKPLNDTERLVLQLDAIQALNSGLLAHLLADYASRNFTNPKQGLETMRRNIAFSRNKTEIPTGGEVAGDEFFKHFHSYSGSIFSSALSLLEDDS